MRIKLTWTQIKMIGRTFKYLGRKVREKMRKC